MGSSGGSFHLFARNNTLWQALFLGFYRLNLVMVGMEIDLKQV
jgi:hypothetical protein